MSKALKYVLIALGILIAVVIIVPLVAALFVDGNFAAERQVEIERPAGEVFEYVVYLQNQDNFSVWGARDPDMETWYRGTDGTVGFISGWSGNDDVGRGEQEITGIIHGERIDYELRFIEPFESHAASWMTVQPAGNNHSVVTWGMSSSMPYPMNLMLLFMDMDEMIGNDFEEGLINLKNLLESRPAADPVMPAENQ
jgi:hypothetical protein